MTNLLVIITAVLAFNGLLMAYLNWAFAAERFKPHRFRAEPVVMRVDASDRRANARRNMLISVGMFYAAVVLLYPWLFVDGPVSWRTIAWQSVLVLSVYDLGYYFMHRYAHTQKWLMKIHAVHHKARYPSARDSLWIHPYETAAGVGLLLLTILALGPVHIHAFAIMFLVYTASNILIHSGIAFPRYPLKLFNGLAEQHYGHHMVNMNRNFATITRFWDRLFGTSL
ncbi:MAG: sterol desaturase family protein [Myxococcales bacterium]|nr:sterol desaturase family protein [Myxococcales bacterium]